MWRKDGQGRYRALGGGGGYTGVLQDFGGGKRWTGASQGIGGWKRWTGGYRARLEKETVRCTGTRASGQNILRGGYSFMRLPDGIMYRGPFDPVQNTVHTLCIGLSRVMI